MSDELLVNTEKIKWKMTANHGMNIFNVHEEGSDMIYRHNNMITHNNIEPDDWILSRMKPCSKLENHNRCEPTLRALWNYVDIAQYDQKITSNKCVPIYETHWGKFWTEMTFRKAVYLVLTGSSVVQQQQSTSRFEHCESTPAPWHTTWTNGTTIKTLCLPSFAIYLTVKWYVLIKHNVMYNTHQDNLAHRVRKALKSTLYPPVRS